MRLRDLAKGSSVFLGVIVAGYLSTTYVDQRFAAPKVSERTESASASACVGEDGSWKNWQWPNVPALSPKCR
ncbi:MULTISPECIES: hypothetical protein [unclassified Bradyrhizobium]|uniref:hypothetical protein n=1 Tax=unclassified Bradyrhizobium TaxID=2631580 RepID=UPI00035C7D99|nr:MULTISPECIES: hypothetical protein [unclassified Bradyrhizobium]MBB4258274.1 hypothetical protein [Bradyrhizobium sp. CIR3A]MBB4381378.1 hypothetical protein [Bradyrhizobium sp. SBR1B]MBB4428767.1 hypothetical protein [Bradyrhizobium sp. CIR48]NYG48922.1 hypothetical protein [Bradyrhizobium sp. IAR9]SFM79724.1 hypothetical protein SAMN05216573_104334 [Bradyrhizobium sp. Rc3b]